MLMIEVKPLLLCPVSTFQCQCLRTLIVTRGHRLLDDDGEVNYKEDPGRVTSREIVATGCAASRGQSRVVIVFMSLGPTEALLTAESKKVLRCDNLRGGFVRVFTADKSNKRTQ